MHEYLQKKENRTGIPTPLKERMERHTGLSLDDVRVHYHSEMPKRLDALAYTQGNQVYIGPGQERHLPHELGHVVQQKQGKVYANARHESGVPMNTDRRLEREADEIGALHGGRKGGLTEGVHDAAVQRKIDPPKEAWDNGALIGAVKGRMKKAYKDAYRKPIEDFYRMIRQSSYSFTNDEILQKIAIANWNQAGTGARLAETMEQEKQAELDLRYGGERGHMVSRHIEISDEDLRARVEGPRAIPRASAFASGVKGKEQALYVLEQLQPILRTLLGDLLRTAGDYLVQEMNQIRGKSAKNAKMHLLKRCGIVFDEKTETDGDFIIRYKRMLEKDGQDFLLSINYSVKVDRVFRKTVRERERPGKAKRVYEAANLYPGRNKPCIRIGPATKPEDVDELVKQSGIDIVGVTFY
ncbi:MAG: DUF4157 domain-containing protein [bacterium]|nr:DUF4157 domain-containing protein [bacterium]